MKKTLMIILVLSPILFIGCTNSGTGLSVTTISGNGNNLGVDRFEDPDFEVVCWKYYAIGKGGISCLPKSEIVPK